jgi:hypothetical protein
VRDGRERSTDVRPPSCTTSGSPRLAAALLFLALAGSTIVFWPLTRVYFFADDFAAMLDIANRGFLRFVVEPFGGHLCLARNAIFYVVYRLFGFDPRPYYWSALLTHLVNVWLFFRVARAFTGSPVLACLGATLWGTCPLLGGALGWYSVYGQVLVGTILLVVLERVEASPAPVSTRVVAGWCALLLAGVFCFGVGIGVALAFPLVLFLLRPAALAERGSQVLVLSLVAIVPALYFGIRRLYFHFVPMPMQDAILAAVALSHYGPIAAMLWHLIGFGVTGIVAGFLVAPQAYPGPASRSLVASFVMAVLAGVLLGDGAARRRIGALASLAVATYALVAVGRANVYALLKVDPWVAARVPRYHYVGTIPLALLLVVLVGQAVRRQARVVSGAVLAGWFVAASAAFVRTGWRLEERQPVRAWVAAGMQSIDAHIAAAPVGGDVYIENQRAPFYVLGPMLGPAEFPGLAGIFVLAHAGNVVDGRRVHFVEPDPATRARYSSPADNRRLAGLLVGPEGVAGAGFR